MDSIFIRACDLAADVLNDTECDRATRGRAMAVLTRACIDAARSASPRTAAALVVLGRVSAVTGHCLVDATVDPVTRKRAVSILCDAVEEAAEAYGAERLT
jgi:hypothetical protein